MEGLGSLALGLVFGCVRALGFWDSGILCESLRRGGFRDSVGSMS